MSTRTQGRAGEQIALAHLRTEGFELVAENFTTRGGEIDLIVQQQSLLVFVEVKWRRTSRYGRASDAITHTKLRRMRSTVVQYLLTRPHHGTIRMDAVCIDDTHGKRHITHLRNIG